ncbi:hypothetical protein BBOR36S_00274 [Brevibacillus borstelensis]
MKKAEQLSGNNPDLLGFDMTFIVYYKFIKKMATLTPAIQICDFHLPPTFQNPVLCSHEKNIVLPCHLSPSPPIPCHAWVYRQFEDESRKSLM